ncbi:hypothetical protein Tco_0053412 [Tanacetum coccineum]
MSDSEHSTVTYTSASEDDLDMGSPGVEVPIFEVPPSPDYIPGPEGPPSPDYVPGPEEPEQAPPSPIYIRFVPEPVYPEFLPVDDEVFQLRSSHCLLLTHLLISHQEDTLSSCRSLQLLLNSADPDRIPCLRVTARISSRHQARQPHRYILSEEVAERVLALPTPPPSSLSPYSSPLPQIPSPPLPIPSPLKPCIC